MGEDGEVSKVVGGQVPYGVKYQKFPVGQRMADKILGLVTPDHAIISLLFCEAISLISPNIFSRRQLATTCLVLAMSWGEYF